MVLKNSVGPEVAWRSAVGFQQVSGFDWPKRRGVPSVAPGEGVRLT
jgi:hypothetical protein